MPWKKFSMLLLVFVLIVSSFGIASAGDGAEPVEPLVPPPSAETGEMTNETPSLWFVELSSPPTADGTSLATVRAEKDAFRKSARSAGLVYTERFAFDTLWNGLSIQIGVSQLDKLERISGVKAIYPVDTIRIPETNPVNDPELATAVVMTGADRVHSDLGFTGAGVKVAVMDTGIDYDHPDLGGCFGTGCRVFTGWDFVGDAFNADSTSPAYNQTPVPDPYPDDCNGHGTHVAGIVGANGKVVGVAPGVTFGAYRVFGCEGSTTADIMIAAMERVLSDHMDVLNMSIGSSFQWPEYPTAQASDRLVNKGVVVVASIGNSGANGLYSAGAPGVGDKVIGVASFDNTHFTFATFTVTPANITAGYTNAAAAPPAPTSGSLPMAKSGTPTSTADACNVGGVSPFSAGQFAGQAVLIRRGTCSFYEKSRNAQNAGAAAVVLYNNLSGRVSPTVAGATPITIPVVAVSDTEGVAINNAIASGPPQTLNWTDQVGSFVNPAGGLVSSFSSYGLSPDLSLKPDIGAPGGFIYSTFPLELGGYATLSGTSMSSPHVAGAAALLLQAYPNTPAQAVRGILQNSAVPKNWWGNPALGLLDNVHRQGAGLLDIYDAILSTTRVDPAKLSLGESQAGPQTRTLTLTNKGATDVTFTLSHAPALSTGPNTFTPAFFQNYASVTFSAPSLTVPAGGTASVDVTVTANSGLPDKSQYGGYIVFTSQSDEQVYRVPYAGFKGDYQSIQVLAPTAKNFPWLAKLVGTSFVRLPSTQYSSVFSMQGNDIPFLLVHLDHQAARLSVDVFAAGSNKAWHTAFQDNFLGRNSTSTSFFAFPFDGTTFAGSKTYTVPDGTYYAVLSVLKANGDPNNPADWETWTSPNITIDRP